MSTNEELHPPPKPRVSPLDFRNTDLVSRLLAATPPYLYNMPLVPNSYFFSEMLRSLVQAKTEAAHRVGTPVGVHHRRSRKRSWTQSRSDYYHKPPAKPEKHESQINWTKPMIPEARDMDRPLELTMNKIPSKQAEMLEGTKVNVRHSMEEAASAVETVTKPQEISNSNVPLMYPNVPQSLSQDPNMPLPPPPIWYPSLYPSPYGIDPLHFFIDLRVSGHIYDRKGQKDASNPEANMPAQASPRSEKPVDLESTETEDRSVNHSLRSFDGNFKQSRQASAFSVPVPSAMKNGLNLTTEKLNSDGKTETKNTKFDVKSMGFDKSYSKTSTNYVLSNIGNIYKSIRPSLEHFPKSENQDIQVDDAPSQEGCSKENSEETEEEKQKKVKDLRALIGLELVVDYMNHAKPRRSSQNFEDSSGDAESNASSVEVVSVEDTSRDVLSY